MPIRANFGESAVSSVALFKYYHYVKKQSYCQKSERLYFTYMGRSRQISHFYLILHVGSLPRFYLYRPNSFWGRTAEN